MDKKQLHELLLPQISALMQGETNAVTNMANFSAVLFTNLPGLNWAGFYTVQGDELLLGPFQGRPACMRLKKGKGVCWAAAAKGQTVIVKNVHEFAGHIACDNATNSEIVVPIVVNGNVWGVLDIDSPKIGRFDETDKDFLEKAVEVFIKNTSFQATSDYLFARQPKI